MIIQRQIVYNLFYNFTNNIHMKAYYCKLPTQYHHVFA